MQFVSFARHGLGIGLAATAAAFLATLLLGAWSERAAFALYLCAAVGSAYIGGVRAGLLSTLLAVLGLLAQRYLLPSAAPQGPGTDFAQGLVLFGVVGAMASWLSSECARVVTAAGRVKHTVGHMRDAVVLTDGQGRITYLNRAARELSGRQEAEALGQPFSWVFTLLDTKTRTALDDPSVQVLSAKSDQVPSRSALLRTRSQGERLVEFAAEAVRSHRGGGPEALVVLRQSAAPDVVDTDQPQRERFRAMAADLPGGLVFLGPDGQCQYCNARSGTLGGFAVEEGLGDGWTRFVHLEDHEIVGEWQTAARREKAFESELRFQDRQGQVRWVQVRAAPLRTPEGGYLGLAGLLEDITAWKEVEDDLGRQHAAAENLKRAHQEQMREIEGRLTNIQKTQALLQDQLKEKQQAEEEARRRHAQERGEWKQREEQLQEQLAELRRTNEDLEEQLGALGEAEELRREFERRRAEWKQAEEELRHEIAELQDGEKQRADLERKQADWKRIEEKLRRELAELRKTKQSLDETLAEQRRVEEQRRKEIQDQGETVKLLEEELAVWQRKEQEARSECERLLPELQALKDQEEHWRRGGNALDRVAERLRPLVADLNEAVHTTAPSTAVEDRVWHLNHFAEGLWAACRLARCELPLRAEPVEAAALLRRVAESASPGVRTRGHHLTLRLPLDPQWLSADPIRLEQALAALVDNAARCTEPGGRIELSAERLRDEIVFRVTDTGHGISDGEMTALRALDARERCFGEGLGVGLALVRGLVESQSGQVELSSDGVDKGCEFRLRFPALNTSGAAVAA